MKYLCVKYIENKDTTASLKAGQTLHGQKSMDT